MPEPTKNNLKAKRAKKPRTRNPETAAPPAVPLAPNPVVLKLQEQILQWVDHRTAMQQQIAASNAALRRAEADARSATEQLQQIEGEVQYRLQLIQQMQGNAGTPRLDIGLLRAAAEPGGVTYGGEAALIPFRSVPQQGIGSVPPNRASTGATDEIRSESAEDERRAM